MQITIRYKNKELFVKLVKSEHYYDEVFRNYRMKHKIMVKCDNTRFYFKYFDSVFKYMQGNFELNSIELIEALKSYIDDALFYLEYGDDINAYRHVFENLDDKSIKKIIKACEKAKNDLVKILGSEDEIYSFYNFLTERIEFLEKLND